MICRVKPATAQGASNRAHLEILGTSDNDGSVQRTIYLNVTRHFGVVLSYEKSHDLQELVPSEYFQLDITVHNLDQVSRNFNLTFDADFAQFQYWRIILVDESIFLEADSEAIVPFLIKPSSSTLPSDEGYEFVISVEDQEDPTMRFVLFVGLNVKNMYSIEMTLMSDDHYDPLHSNPGERHHFQIQIRNTGNTEVIVILRAPEVPDDWSVDLFISADVLMPGQTKYFYFDVYVSENADDGEVGTIIIESEILDRPETTQESTIWISIHDPPDPAPSPSVEYFLIFLMIAGLVSVVLIRYVEYRYKP